MTRIIVAEDSRTQAQKLRLVLESAGFEVEVAGEGQAALEQFRSSHFDLVLSDVMMPRMDGYEATRRIRAQQRFKHLPVIALTAKAMREDRQKCMEAGANDYLAKPVDVDRLLSMIRALLPKRQEVGA